MSPHATHGYFAPVYCIVLLLQWDIPRAFGTDITQHHLSIKLSIKHKFHKVTNLLKDDPESRWESAKGFAEHECKMILTVSHIHLSFILAAFC